MSVAGKSFMLPNFVPSGEKGQGSLLDYCKHLHQVELQRLQLSHRSGSSGKEIVEGRALLMDHLLKQIHGSLLTQESGKQGQRRKDSEGLAIVALGGYGRGELAPFSDVDLMFLVTHRQISRENRHIQAILYLLWDMGLEVGHSARTVKEALDMGSSDLVSLVSMLDARFLVGDHALYQELKHKLIQLVEKNRIPYGQKFLESVRERHVKQGGTAFIQEPNVKEVKGGLRDFHSVGWIAGLVYPGNDVEKTMSIVGIHHQEWKEATGAYDFLLRLRNEMHFLCGRHQDEFTHELVTHVGEIFHFKRQHFQKETESFLNHYYLEVRRISFVFEMIWNKAAAEVGLGKKWPGFRILSRRSEKAKETHIVLEKFRIAPSPEKALWLLAHCNEEGDLFKEEARHSIRSMMPQFPGALWFVGGVTEVFRKILGRRGQVGPVIRNMHEIGFLGKLLPEFGRLTCLVEHDHYHKYTTDEHTLKALEVLDQISSSQLPQEIPYQKVLSEIPDCVGLYLALLLHDVGKGLGGNHSVKGAKLAVQAMLRLGFPREEIEAVEFLIENHLLLSHISQRRNLDDPDTIERVASTVKRLDYLNRLLLLTYADMVSTGPDVWTEWNDYLLWRLFTKTYERLMFARARDSEARHEVVPARRKVEELLENEMSRQKVTRHLDLLPEKYVLYTPLEQIRCHLRLVDKLQGEGVVFGWIDHPREWYSDLLMVTKDRPGLFARIAGGLAAFNMSILSAQLNTRKDRVVCDVFQVASRTRKSRLHAEDYPRVERFLKRIIAGQVDLEEHLRSGRLSSFTAKHGHMPPRVRVDNTISPSATVVEIQAEDRVGLGYRIASVMAQLRLNIIYAKLATEKAQAFDVFYVTDQHGKKIHENSRLSEIVEWLQQELSEPAANNDCA
jgi:[protein-PII] uridylyltransferase